MKFLVVFVFALSTSVFAQETDYHTKKGYVAEGYDVVAYFDNQAIEGDKQFSTEFESVKYKFASKENLDKFNSSPEKYIPQYGGYCAYAMADKGKKVGIDPESFEIRDGKLYLFYDSFFSHTLKSWLENDPKELQKKADKNWKAVMKKE